MGILMDVLSAEPAGELMDSWVRNPIFLIMVITILIVLIHIFNKINKIK